ncbi:carbohydrate-binding family 9-like protein [Paenibacillus sp. NPDC058071]|uniref:carbohydrate-binding family 9-like protein n=1 Tax=Paenibacillus sp. NPDC058071 TaxID=3346326 RepID=UPI0036D8FE43
MNSLKRYLCKKVQGPIESVNWELLDSVSLSNVIDGERARLQTNVKLCWSDEAIMVHFDCEDDHVVATMTDRDDPLFHEDVVEIFLDDAGQGLLYREFVISPNNVVYDALIVNDGEGQINAGVQWNADGLLTSVHKREDGSWRCELSIPLMNFDAAPAPGSEWRFNLYRIDDDKEGNRHFWAWSPTGAIEFHLSKHFGTLVFAD